MENSSMSDETLDNSLVDTLETIINNAPAPTVGWMEGNSSIVKHHLALEDDRNKEQHSHIESDDDIPEIPDIEDLQDDLASPQKVKQPTIFINRSTYKELDDELSKAQVGSNLQTLLKGENINLLLLIKKMLPEKDIREPVDEEWTMESLYNELIAMGSSKKML